MSLWGIVLDGITLINLVMCIGFSVDFCAHIAYHYIDAKKKTEDSDVVDQSLVSVVKPIFQAATSTILGIKDSMRLIVCGKCLWVGHLSYNILIGIIMFH